MLPPLSCRVTGIHWCQVSGSWGALFRVNQSYVVLIQALVGIMPDGRQIGRRTMPGGMLKVRGTSVSSDFVSIESISGSLYICSITLCQMGAAPIAPATCAIVLLSLLPTHTPTA